MGYASRLNPRSFDHAESERAVLNARLVRFCAFFPNREAYERYLSGVPGMTDEWRGYLEQFLPDGLKATASV